jgi:hypothetical protein
VETAIPTKIDVEFIPRKKEIYVLVGKAKTQDNKESEVVCKIRRVNKKVVCDAPRFLEKSASNFSFGVVSAPFFLCRAFIKGFFI